MTNEERIAVGLLGWRRAPTYDGSFGTCYQRGNDLAYLDEKRSETSGPWPNFRTLDGCQEFEVAISDRGLWPEYSDALWQEVYGDFPEQDNRATRMMGVECGALATPAQRVAACIAVIDEAGL